jgi:hypothetical protein
MNWSLKVITGSQERNDGSNTRHEKGASSPPIYLIIDVKTTATSLKKDINSFLGTILGRADICWSSRNSY